MWSKIQKKIQGKIKGSRRAQDPKIQRYHMITTVDSRLLLRPISRPIVWIAYLTATRKKTWRKTSYVEPKNFDVGFFFPRRKSIEIWFRRKISHVTSTFAHRKVGKSRFDADVKIPRPRPSPPYGRIGPRAPALKDLLWLERTYFPKKDITYVGIEYHKIGHAISTRN